MLQHWSVDEKTFKKNHPEKYKLWRLTFNINGGLKKGEKLDKNEVKRAWPYIKNDIEPYLRRLLKFLIWGKLYSLPTNVSFWSKPQKING